MENEKNKKINKYKKIIDTTIDNDKLNSKDKKDIIDGIVASMRSEMFGGKGLSDALNLKKKILETDKDITQAKTDFQNSRNSNNCRRLKDLCLKQKNNLKEYSKLDKTPVNLNNKNLDTLLEQCAKLEKRNKKIEDEYSQKLQFISEKIGNILSIEFKTRSFSDYKNLLRLASEGKRHTEYAEKNCIKIPRLNGMSVFVLDKHIELAEEQIQYFEKMNSQNEEKIRALNQEIINALVPINQRNTTASINIIRLCQNMKKQISFLDSKGTKIPKLRFTDMDNLDKCIEIEEKRIEDEKERKRRQEEERKRHLQECANRVSSYDRELARYKNSSNCNSLSIEECQGIISTARKLKKEIEYLRENKYKVSQIIWINPDFLIQKMGNRISKIKEMRDELISDIKSRDQTISGMIHRDYKALSIDECRQIIGVCKDQKRKMEYCKSKGVFIPRLNNGNMDYLINKFEDLCQNKIKWEKEQRERQKEKERLQRERERQQRERENQKQREQEERKRRAAIDAQEIYEGLKYYIAERNRVQERQDEHWKVAHRGKSQEKELYEDSDEIGRINHEINKLIGRLMKHPKQYSCYKLAIDFLEREIERCQCIYEVRSRHIEKVARGNGSWVNSDGKVHYDNTSQIKYVAHLDDKIRRYREQLRKLREMNQQ